MSTLGGNDELTDLLRKTPAILRALTARMSEEHAHRRDAGGWSTVEIIGHLIDAERRAIDRIAQLQIEDNPVLEGYDQMGFVERSAYQQRDLEGVLRDFDGVRAERIAALAGLSDDGWARRATLSTYGQGTLRDITIHMSWHDMNHLAQISGMRKRE